MGNTAEYVLDLAEQLLGPAERETRFDWCLGDDSEVTGRAARLPFDAVWEDRKLIVEVDEDQHREATPHFDKPDRLTVSGVHRGKQRRLYDQRKRDAAAANGYTLVPIEWSRRDERGPGDLARVREHLRARGVTIEPGD